VGFYRPHCPYITPKGYFQKYALNEITLPEIPDGEQSRVPAAALQGTGKWPYDGVTAEQARECKRAYYAAISFVDAQIGRVLDSLDRLGLRENTAIVFWSDHGYHLGEHGLWYKQSCYEESTRVPFIISVPGQKTRGADTQRTVELLDIYPTLADFAGLPAPGYIEGASLRPLLESPSAAWDRPAFSQVERNGFPGHSVRTERWRYTEWGYGEKGAELYDHSNDPGEHRNLFQSPEHAAVVAEMKALLKKAHPAKVEGGKSDPAFLNSLGLRSE
jgi:iduronate 2-sulfatase